ncbi:ABC-F family ATP-binding cassette domain-containing protein [uncultured Porphyromonas sp.]|uniref:ABC-F family ATP-binding cassette domain-containing protein n=1 Tax=uncultured Porphyromonas sp. TaxID=159274 RepID=UPI00260B6870|nr:ABC-F family ATP-binding cassette domain-containing protein [uncultured Porphyromonas sp.]
MLQVDQLTKSFGDRVLFSDLSFSIERGQKVGLIAPNGTGKSTLMRILLGLEPQDSGTVIYERDLRRAYLPQLPELTQQGTILEACFSPYDPVAQLTLSWERAVAEGDSRRMEELLPEMEAQGAWDYEQRAKEILGALGLHELTKPITKLSGGEAKRVALAGALISQPDLLLLDEPTNHLDLASIEWLEDYLSRSTMGLLLITHDRYFLDRVCNQIIELDAGTLYRYKGNYDYYLAKRQERHEQAEALRQRALNLYRRELEWMRRQPQARGTKAQYRIDAFHALEQQTRTPRQEGAIALGESGAGYIGKKIFEAQHVSKRFGDKVILEDFNYIFSRYDKVGIVGENGVGKTSFLRMLLGELAPDAGAFDIGETVRFGYYSQQPPAFAPERRVIDIVQDLAENFTLPAGSGVERLSASQILTRFLFPPERQYTPVEKLSGGELRRLYLCTVLVTCPNFLILDEPTNDLDILTLQALEEYLQDFAGCVLIVSHDRFFMDKVTEHLLCFEGAGKVRDFPGNYTQYRAFKAAEERRAVEQAQAEAQKAAAAAPASRGASPRAARLSYAERKELEQIEQQLRSLDEERASLEAQLATGTLEHQALMKASERIGAIIELQDELTLRQLELEERQG